MESITAQTLQSLLEQNKSKKIYYARIDASSKPHEVQKEKSKISSAKEQLVFIVE